MFEFIQNTPPESALYMGLTTGALLDKVVTAILKKKLRQAAGVSAE